jgi:YidC/Oxa1 family membrane protein insertase
MSSLWEVFTLVVYQPFFNILLFFYWALGIVGTPDMGVAVILLTLVIRVLMLPLSLSGHRSEASRREIAAKIKDIETEYSHDPVASRKAVKQVFKGNSRVVVSEMISLGIQVAIALMLWRIFGTGLEGEDLHLLYPFMPKIEFPFNLIFWDTFDLSKPSLTLNLFQTFLIFILETLSVLTSPYPPTKGEVVRLQLTLPLVSFVIFMGLPAGKKLFVITTLLCSIALTLLRYIKQRYLAYKEKHEISAEKADEPIVSEA